MTEITGDVAPIEIRDSDFYFSRNENSQFDYFKFLEIFWYIEKNAYNVIALQYCRHLFCFYSCIFFTNIMLQFTDFYTEWIFRIGAGSYADYQRKNKAE